MVRKTKLGMSFHTFFILAKVYQVIINDYTREVIGTWETVKESVMT